jgi:hypothetical protein
MSKLQYCAQGEYGIEFFADTEKEVQDWIDTEVRGEGNADEPVPADYYSIITMTRAELKALPEV